MTRLDEALANGLAAWVRGVHARASLLAWSLSAITLLLAAYALLNLGINSDNTRILDDDVESMQRQREFARLFPALDNALIVVIDGDVPEQTRDAADWLVERMRADETHFIHVFEPGGGPFFERNGLLYRSVTDLEEFSDQVIAAQPLLAELERDSSLANLARLVRLGLTRVQADSGDALAWSEVLDRVSDAAVGVYAEHPVFVSWEEMLLRGSSLEVDPRRVLMVEPVLDFDALLPAGPAIGVIRELAREYGGGVSIRVTGNPALNHEEMLGLAWDIGVAGVFCFLLVALVVLRALRSFVLVVASLVTLLAGLLWTAAYAAVSVGQVNLISICFAVLFIGLGIDFAIHFGMQYAASRRSGRDHEAGLEEAARVVGSSLVLCAITTAIGFFVFVPTDYRGVAELGLISGGGMFVMLFLNLTFLPALLSTWLRYEPGEADPSQLVLRSRWVSLPERHARAIRWTALALGVGGLLVVPGARFDPDVVKLRDPGSESVQAFADLLDDNAITSPWFANVLAEDLKTAESLAARFRELPSVGLVVTLSDFVPEEQDEKIEVLEDLAMMLDVPPGAAVAEPPGTEEQIAALADLRDFLAEVLAEPQPGEHRVLVESMRKLRRELDVLLDRIEAEGRPEEALASFEAILLGGLPDQLARLRGALSPDVVTLESLPEELVGRMVAPDDRIRIQIFPAENLNGELALRRFVEAIDSIRPDAIGLAVSLVEFGRVTVESLRQALVTAIASIALLLWLLWRRWEPPLLVLAPLLLGAVLTAAAMVGLGIRFNFANVIVIPLLLGMGVDSGIHLVHRARTEGLAPSELMATTTARAVFYSAITTVVSFGSLALSSHLGMVSLGKTLVVGLGLTLFANLVVLPALLARGAPKAEPAPREAADATR
ncbi:MAG: MMPL family transporter [Myxococcota bacterium]